MKASLGAIACGMRQQPAQCVGWRDDEDKVDYVYGGDGIIIVLLSAAACCYARLVADR